MDILRLRSQESEFRRMRIFFCILSSAFSTGSWLLAPSRSKSEMFDASFWNLYKILITSYVRIYFWHKWHQGREGSENPPQPRYCDWPLRQPVFIDSPLRVWLLGRSCTRVMSHKSGNLPDVVNMRWKRNRAGIRSLRGWGACMFSFLKSCFFKRNSVQDPILSPQLTEGVCTLLTGCSSGSSEIPEYASFTSHRNDR